MASGLGAEVSWEKHEDELTRVSVAWLAQVVSAVSHRIVFVEVMLDDEGVASRADGVVKTRNPRVGDEVESLSQTANGEVENLSCYVCAEVVGTPKHLAYNEGAAMLPSFDAEGMVKYPLHDEEVATWNHPLPILVHLEPSELPAACSCISSAALLKAQTYLLYSSLRLIFSFSSHSAFLLSSSFSLAKAASTRTRSLSSLSANLFALSSSVSRWNALPST